MKTVIAISITAAGILIASAITGAFGVVRDMNKEMSSMNVRLVRIEILLNKNDK